jgi:hypothetical protein
MSMSNPSTTASKRRTFTVLEECCPAVLSARLSEDRAVERAADLAVFADRRPARIRG